jgi:leader peptidase (prepilin peptidase)/N-methyltransferase
MLEDLINPQYWHSVPFHYWTAVFFIFGSIWGSFLNVCIHRMPLGLSVVNPPSHCPSCEYQIPWHQNIPLVSWLQLGGKCANCGSGISARYFLVELLTGIAFLCAWIAFGPASPLLAMANCVVLAGFICATLIDFEHFIIPDEITLGGVGVGFIASALIPSLHQASGAVPALGQSLLGIVVGGGVVYAILRMGKWMFGKKRVNLEPDSKLTFTDVSLFLPGEEIPYDELFYRKSDFIGFRAKRLELADRCYVDAPVRLTQNALIIGEETLDPEPVRFMEVVTDEIILPREAMGLGDVKFMAAIGAFMGWQATLFTLMFSSVIGSFVGVGLIAIGKRSWSARIPYGPYIALAAIIWMFLDPGTQAFWRGILGGYAGALDGG